MFTRGEFADFVEKVFGEGVLSNGGANISVCCPYCNKSNNKKKMVIETISGILHCWVCDFRSRNLLSTIGKFHPDFLDEYKQKFWLEQRSANEGEVARKPIVTNNELTLPNGFMLLAPYWGNQHDLTPDIKKAIEYLKKRGITENDTWKFKLGVTHDKETGQSGRIIIPSYNSEGKLNFYTGRSFVGHKKKYLNPIFNHSNEIINELFIDWSSPLMIVEGMFDAFKCPWNTTPLLGSNIDESFALFRKIVKNKTPTIFALDPDAYQKTLKKLDLFLTYKVKVSVVLSMKNSKKDFGDMKKELIEKMLRSDVVEVTQEWLWKERMGKL